MKSLGAKFIYVDLAEAATAAGYARELTAEEKAKQAELVSGHVKSQDIVITTDRKSTRLNSSHVLRSRMPSSA